MMITIKVRWEIYVAPAILQMTGVFGYLIIINNQNLNLEMLMNVFTAIRAIPQEQK